jgi:leucyl aminopeptidase
MTMKTSFSNQPAVRLKTDLLVITLPEGWKRDDPSLAALDGDDGLKGALGNALTGENYKGKARQSASFNTLGAIGPARVFVAGLGSQAANVDALRDGLAAAGRAARGGGLARMAVLLPPGLDDARGVAAAVEGAALGNYRFDRYVQESDRRAPLKELKVARVKDDGRGDGRAVLQAAERAVAATSRARDLVNEPASVVNPPYLAEVAEQIARADGALRCEVFSEKDLVKKGMNLLYGVGKGSASPPRLIHLTYRPAGRVKSDRRAFIVGKGITFDSGGYSLKQPDFMKDMKCDMAGAAAVLCAMEALPAVAPGFEVHGLVAAAENMVDGTAYRVGDIITGYGGKSVEIHNTDAEGRLVLADALSYAVETGATEIVDLATLTGACMIALGPYTAGLFSTSDTLADGILRAGESVGEEFWRMPLTPQLRDKLKTPVADLKNVAGRYGGAITAALFLKEFVGSVPWAHLDIAGPAFGDEEWGVAPKGASGFGVRTLLAYLGGKAATAAKP